MTFQMPRVGYAADMGSLTPDDRAILDFELTWSAHLGSKRDFVARQFGMSIATYYRRRNALLELPEAAAYAPSLVRRLRAR